MSQSVVSEGATLSEALSNSISQLGVNSIAEITWDYVREHFKEGAWTVQLTASLRSEEELAGMRSELERAEVGAAWMRKTLEVFGTTATVHGTLRRGKLVVEVSCEADGSLLIGKEGRNLGAFQALLSAAMLKSTGDGDVLLDIEGYLQRGPASPRGDRGYDDDRGRGRGRDDDRGRGRGRDDDRGRGRDDDRGRGRDDDRGRGRDGDRGRGRRERDPERDNRIVADAREAAQAVQDGGDTVVINDMNSYERRLVHQAVKEFDGVRSRSVGEGSQRSVEIAAD